MVDLGVYNFVKNAVAAGKSKEEVMKDLTRGGQLSPATIEEAFAAVESGTPPSAGMAAAAVAAPGPAVSFQERVTAAGASPTISSSTVGLAAPSSRMNNTSGEGAASTVPAEVLHWNWGAFGFSWLWGIFNGTWIALLALIPVVNIIMVFVLGAKGSEWAWRNKRWESVEHFRRVQKRWSLAFFICLILSVVLLGALFLSIEKKLSQVRVSSQQALQEMEASQTRIQAELEAANAL